MRQAGRYMARAGAAEVTACFRYRAAGLTVAVTYNRSMPSRRRTILFSDLLLPFTMGLEFDFIKGEGPSIGINPQCRRRRSPSHLRAPTGTRPRAETIRLLRRG
jgi:uroporphyrinogen-III decarboxylase